MSFSYKRGFSQGCPNASVISSDLRRGKGVGKRKDKDWDAVGITEGVMDIIMLRLPKGLPG